MKEKTQAELEHLARVKRVCLPIIYICGGLSLAIVVFKSVLV